MKASRPPHLPLADLEAILGDISALLERLLPEEKTVAGADGAARVRELDGRIVQCRSAIDACRRHHFSPVLLRALSAKVIEVEADALVLRRTLKIRERPATREAPKKERAEAERRPRPRRGSRRGIG